jgi:hypothetical protein
MEVGMAKILAMDEYPSIRDLLSEGLTEEGNMVVSTGDLNLISLGDGLPLKKEVHYVGKKFGCSYFQHPHRG